MTRPLKLSGTWATFVGIVACAVLLFLRATERLSYPELYAEDGIWFNQALTHGWDTLFMPFAGSYFFIQRLIILLSLGLAPFEWIPLCIMVSSLLIFAVVGGGFVSSSFAWLWPNRWARVLIALLFCLAPGTFEMAGNLANLNWILFFGITLIALRSLESPTRWWHVALFLLLSVSCGTFVLLVPLLAWRLWKTPPARRVRESSLLLVSAALIVVLLFTKQLDEVGAMPALARQMAETLNTFFDSVISQPWIGDWPTIWTSNLAWPYRSIGFLLFGGVLFYFGRLHRSENWFQAILLFTCAIALWPVLCWLARPGRIEYFEMPLAGGFWRYRYSFPLAIPALMFWSAVLSRGSLGRAGRRLLLVGFLALNVVWSVYRFRLGALGTNRHWENNVAALKQAYDTGCPEKLDVPITPEGWVLVFKSPKGCPGN